MAAANYGKVHRAFHWATVGLMIAVFPVGVFISDVKYEPVKYFMYDWHKWLGLTILLATAFRLAWKLTHPVEHATDINAFERTVSHLVHLALYAMLFAVPLMGWAATNALGFPIHWFWVITLPELLSKNAELGFTLLAVHQWMAWGLAALFTAHIGASLMHHIVKKDSVLGRMMPSKARVPASTPAAAE